MYKHLSLKVDFLAGTSITDAVEQAKELAIELNVSYIKFDFNGVNVSVGQNADVDSAYLKYTTADKYLILN